MSSPGRARAAGRRPAVASAQPAGAAAVAAWPASAVSAAAAAGEAVAGGPRAAAGKAAAPARETTSVGGRGAAGASDQGPAADQLGEVLGALADPTRRRILDLLAARGAVSASALAPHLPVTRQAVVKHLAVLDHSGLVAGQRRGREVRYRLRPDRVTATAEWLTDLAAGWDRRLAALKSLAEAEP